MKRRIKKKHKKRKNRKRGVKVSPVTAAMAFAAASGGIPNLSSFQKSRNGRRASDTSVWSNNSTKSFKISMEKIEITASNRNSDASDSDTKVFVHSSRTVRHGSFSSSCTDRGSTTGPIPNAKDSSLSSSKTSFTMFTASTLLTSLPNAMEMLDMDTQCSCTDCDDACEEFKLFKKLKQFRKPCRDLEAEISDISTTSV